jgi:hypothetical protein
MLLPRRVVSVSHNTAFLCARTLAELEDRTRAVEGDPAACGSLSGCVEIDTGVALLPFVTVLLNGEEVLVQPGSTVGRCCRKTGIPTLRRLPGRWQWRATTLGG